MRFTLMSLERFSNGKCKTRIDSDLLITTTKFGLGHHELSKSRKTRLLKYAVWKIRERAGYLSLENCFDAVENKGWREELSDCYSEAQFLSIF
jgi:hypothetical protein